MNIIAWNPETDVAVTPERLPEIGEYAKFEDGNSIWFCGYNPAPTFTDLEIAEMSARDWRDAELSSSDTASQTPDWPNRDNILNYRTALRDWPSTGDFPATRPTLGS